MISDKIIKNSFVCVVLLLIILATSCSNTNNEFLGQTIGLESNSLCLCGLTNRFKLSCTRNASDNGKTYVDLTADNNKKINFMGVSWNCTYNKTYVAHDESGYWYFDLYTGTDCEFNIDRDNNITHFFNSGNIVLFDELPADEITEDLLINRSMSLFYELVDSDCQQNYGKPNISKAAMGDYRVEICQIYNGVKTSNSFSACFYSDGNLKSVTVSNNEKNLAALCKEDNIIFNLDDIHNNVLEQSQPICDEITSTQGLTFKSISVIDDIIDNVYIDGDHYIGIYTTVEIDYIYHFDDESVENGKILPEDQDSDDTLKVTFVTFIK